MTIRGNGPQAGAWRRGALFAAIAAAVCIFLSARIWITIGALRPMWPFPALYLLELPALCAVSAFGLWVGARFRRIAIWVTAGVLGAFCVLGAWSVGLAYVPVLLLVLVAAVLCAARHQGWWVSHAAAGLAAALAQAVAMLAFARFV